MAKKKTVAKKKGAPKRKAAPKRKVAPKKKAAKRAKKPTMEMLLVGSKTKAALKGYGLNVAGDALEGLNGVLYWYIEQAAKRAEANNRKTVRAHDFVVM